jgi:uncharacterized membrane protein YtjA (UPF0391 family)
MRDSSTIKGILLQHAACPTPFFSLPILLRALVSRAIRDFSVRSSACSGPLLAHSELPHQPHPGEKRENDAMLHYAIVFFVIALIAAVFGFTGIAAGAAEIAKILFYVFLVVFVVTLLLGVLRG